MPTSSATSISRPRVAYACRECRRRKLKCDLGQPECARCLANLGSQCRYDTEIPTFRRPELSTTSAASTPRPSKRRGDEPGEVLIPVERLDSIETRLQSLGDLVNILQASISTTSGTSSANEHGSRNRSPPESGGNPVQTQFGSQRAHQARYISTSHWAAICTEAAEIETLLAAQIGDDNVNSSTDHTTQRDVLLAPPPIRRPSYTNSPRIRRPVQQSKFNMPDQATCDVLFDSFVSNFHPIVPLVHIPSLRKKYEDFFLESTSAAKTDIFVSSLLLAALFAGAVTLVSSGQRRLTPGLNPEILAIQLHKEATTALFQTRFPRGPTIETLSAYLILQGTWMRDEEPLTTCGFIGVAVRVAQMLGLHRDPSHYTSEMSQINTELCRRVWWHVFYVDVLVAVASGLPPLIDRGSWDTQMPNQSHEEDWGSGVLISAEGRSRSRYLPVVPELSATEASPLISYLRGKCEEACK